MKLSDLKRLPVGTKLRCVKNFQGPCDLPREVMKMQTNGMSLRGPVSAGGEEKTGWCEFPRADGFTDDGDGFSLTKGGVTISYKFVRPASHSDADGPDPLLPQCQKSPACYRANGHAGGCRRE